MDTGYEDWEPPSEATMKLLQARRERSDRISKLMGDYLLKGYKMLGTTCPQCDTILLQTKQGTKYCIACSELDSDADKDDPVTNQAAALAQARELEEREPSSKPAAVAPPLTKPSPSHPLPPPSVLCKSEPEETPSEVSVAFPTPDLASLSRVQQPPPGIAFVQGVSSANGAGNNASGDCFGWGGENGGERYVRAILDKMDWATGELRATRSVDYSIQLCSLIKGCAEAVGSIRAAWNLRC